MFAPRWELAVFFPSLLFLHFFFHVFFYNLYVYDVTDKQNETGAIDWDFSTSTSHAYMSYSVDMGHVENHSFSYTSEGFMVRV